MKSKWFIKRILFYFTLIDQIVYEIITNQFTQQSGIFWLDFVPINLFGQATKDAYFTKFKSFKLFFLLN